jgi:radical SAM superfamily enzyme YgiQ (UPF0313 family)
MKIALIQPPWSNLCGKFQSLARVEGLYPPLGIAYLATIAEEMGHEVLLVDGEANQISMQDTYKKIKKFNPDILGITSATPLFDKATKLAKAVKKSMKTTVLIGGPHITALKEKAFDDGFDVGFIGEAEETFKEFLENFGDEDAYQHINGLMLRKGNKVFLTAHRPYMKDLDSIKFPARHLMNLDRYLSSTKRGLIKHTTIMASRGCPFQCVFCSQHTMFGRVARFRSGKNVVDEMEEAYRKHGIDHFIFVDSTLTLKRSQVEEICHEIIKRKLNKITWEGWTRANLIDEKLLRLMKRAGFIRISFGIESGDPRILKLIKKEVKLEDIRKAYKLVEKVGIEATCSVMIGHPGETRESIMKTIRFVRSIPQVKYSPLSITVPYPGTEVLDMAKKRRHGLKLHTEDYTKFSRYGNSVMSVNDLSPEDLIKFQKKGLLLINLTPRRIWYQLRRTTIKEALENAYAFAKAFI